MPRGQRADRTPKGRNERPLLGGVQQKLNYTPRKGYVARYVNDAPGRIASFEAAGYSLVTQDEPDSEGRAQHVRERVGTKNDGSPLYAYAMEKPKDWYDEDMARKQATNDEREAQIFEEGQVEHDASTGGRDRSRFYVKHAEISRSEHG